MPLIVQSTKQTTTLFNLSIIKNHMQTATKRTATLAETKVAIVNMYQNGTTAKLSPQAQKAAHVLAQYIHANKTGKKFAFVLGKDHQDQQLLLLTISNHPIKSQTNASLQKAIQQVSINTQKQQNLSLVKQLSWVTNALHKAKFGILFWIYQHRLSAQEALPGTKQVPFSITAINFQRVKTPHEQLQDEAWAKIMQVIQNLTSHQLKIRANDQELPSQTKTTTSDILLAIQNIIANNDEISKVAKKLMKEDNIEMQPDDKMGAMIITIKNYGNDKIITIFGFKAIGTPLEVAQAKIKAAKAGANLPTKLTQVFYGQMPIASNVNAPMKEGVIFKFQSATAINNKGESTLTYEVDVDPQVDGATPQDVTFVVSGFETQVQAADRISKLVQVAIQNLIATDFTTGINKDQIASVGKPLKAHVISDIKSKINNTDAQALILPSDITITSNSIAQTITIVIHNHGPVKTITIAGFKFISIKNYLDQLLNAIPSLGGTLDIPEGITSTQFDAYVQAMGDVLNAKNEFVMNKFAEQYRAKITSLTIPHSFTTIGSWFQDFDKIISLRIPNSVTTIGDFAFYSSPLTTLSLGEALQTIGSQAFYYAQLISLTIPNSVTTIGSFAFASSPLTTLLLGDHLQTIRTGAFQGAQLTSLSIPSSVIHIYLDAFVFSPLTNVKVFDDVVLGANAFKSAIKITYISRSHEPTL